ncbi:MAG: ECF RNA polymerase sigma factor SigL [Bacteroidetes bacterium ADurb.Bin123]|nr:MAG: ECF RNA polymerase sigma factor SigL [Bacteroidetes bacterium ADurb.Bin123]
MAETCQPAVYAYDKIFTFIDIFSGRRQNLPMVPMEDLTLFNRIRNGDRTAFKSLFDAFYAPMCHYASHFLNDDNQAEEVVQDLFVKIWERRMELVVETSLKHYLFRSVRNQCLNLIRRDKVRQLHAMKLRDALLSEDAPEDYSISPEKLLRIEEGIASLPEKRQEIFRLNREEGLKYREIAEKLGISVKTVEAQMGAALKSLREKFRTLLFFLVLGLM